MDTFWFAVDADGHVGLFDSGQDGAVPASAAVGISPSDATVDLHNLAVFLLGHMGVDPSDPDDPWDTVDMADSSAPLFRFGREHGTPAGCYERDVVPTESLVIDEFPADLRATLSQCRLQTRFTEVEDIQLADLLPEDELTTVGARPLR